MTKMTNWPDPESLTILTAPSRILSTPTDWCLRYFRDSLPLQPIIKKMLDIMQQYGGAGLAAPQVGLRKSFFVTESGQVFIDPRILERSDETDVCLEGCLSIPNIRLPIRRAKSIVIEYYDAEGNDRTETLTGFEARLAQHEIDHLDGVLFPSRFARQFEA